MTFCVGPKGQVVIPKAIRDELGILPGDEIVFSLEDNAVRMEAKRSGTSLRGSLAGLGATLMLESDRRVERER
jgi:AbrB family looped-hinge helix DNA binding protein